MFHVISGMELFRISVRQYAPESSIFRIGTIETIQSLVNSIG